ncbi:DUF4153 domain-containing protein [Campylobacter gastrosuis]|uniref:DUF4153 domain-containing protein n=1 Tax=Campylobacter gastrosuis TaxID=2974576 RepID=A0ABT7HNU3_9BACT|nr:DUF4153 domain-containing protein [Campylobacter gastrosuis]MDL0088574.1 DUF4153 domain-containing protein [Campylobacter gastrosuis]
MFKKSFLNLIKNNPVEFLLIFLVTTPFLLFSLEFLEIFGILYAFSGIAFCIIHLANGTRFYKISFVFVAVFYIFLIKFSSNLSDFIQFLALNFIVFLTLLSMPFYSDDELFLSTFIKNLTAVIYAFFIMLGVFVLVCGFIASVSYLFDFIFGGDYVAIFFTLFFLITPTLFLYFKNSDITLKFGVVFEILFSVVSLFLLAYTALLYIYFAVIAISFELPRGMLSLIILPYLAFGVIFYCLKGRYSGKFLAFYRYFGLICLIPLVMLFVAVLRRVGEYGFTTDRFYLLALAVLFSVFAVLLLFRAKISRFMISFIVCIFVAFFIFDATKISLNSQINRLNSLLLKQNALDEKGKIKADFNIKEGEEFVVAREIYKLFNYDKAKFEEIYGKNGVKIFLEFKNYTNSVITFKLDKGSELDLISEFGKIIYVTDYVFSDDNATKRGDLQILNDDKEIMSFHGDKFISEVFKKNSLDINQTYTKSELESHKYDFLQKADENGTLVFSEIEIRNDGAGYKFKYAKNALFIKKK